MAMAGRSNVTDRDDGPRLSNPWVVLFTLLLVSIFNFADRYLVTGLISDIKREFGVDDGFMGMLIGPKKKKYVEDANGAGGNYMDYFQWKSGEAGTGATQVDGHVASERVNKGGLALTKAEGECKAGMCTVTFTRKLSGGEGDLALAEGQVVPFGIAIHADKTIHRFHHVSLGYTLGLGANADVKASNQ